MVIGNAVRGRRFAPYHPLDRTFFLFYLLLIWVAILGGFGLDLWREAARGGLHYPLIVHVHALAFLGWLALFSVQILLIRRGNIRLHRRLGLLSLLLLPAMIVLGPATAIVMNAARYGPGHTSFPFMSTQFTNVLASSVLIIAGLWWRKSASAHKRLMLMGTLALTEPGLSRIYAGWLYDRLGEGSGPYLVETYIGGFVLMLGVGLYDLATRGRLHPAYVAAFGWCVANEMAAAWLYYQPWWGVMTGHLVGH